MKKSKNLEVRSEKSSEAESFSIPNSQFLIPPLRFPEFRAEEPWEPTTIGALGNFYYGKSAPKWSLSEDAPTPCVRYGELYTKFGPVITETYSRTNTDPDTLRFSKGGEILIPRVGEKPDDFGKCCCYLPLKGIAIGEMISVLETKQHPLFYTYYFRHLHKQFAAVVEGQNVKNLYYAELEPLPIHQPSIPEQQKIAECLSSMDEVIAAQARKVDALKTHKKGLLQKLFPPAIISGSENCEERSEKKKSDSSFSIQNSNFAIPPLRFPEFQNAGEWVVKPLGEIFPITSSKRVHESDWTPTGVPFYRAREIVALNKREPIQPLFISEELYTAYSKQTGEIRDGHLLVTGVGSIGVPYLVRAGDRFYFKDGNIIWLKNDGKELSGEFLLRLYETDFVQKQLEAMADVGTVATYTIDNAKRTLAAFPEDLAEQHRIASCLSSLDALIAAETQKHAALQRHKRGLMQQLFPSPEKTS